MDGEGKKKQQQQLTTYRDNKDILLYVSSLCLGIQGSGKWRGGGGGGGNGKEKEKKGPWNSLLTSLECVYNKVPILLRQQR